MGTTEAPLAAAPFWLAFNAIQMSKLF